MIEVSKYLAPVEKSPLGDIECFYLEEIFMGFSTASIIKLAEEQPYLSIVNLNSFEGPGAKTVTIRQLDAIALEGVVQRATFPAWKNEYEPQEWAIGDVAASLSKYTGGPATFMLLDENNKEIPFMIMFHPNTQIDGVEV